MLYLNGKIISNDQAHIEVTDRGFLLGDGLFETIACHRGKAVNLSAHWFRLEKGARLLSIPITISLSEISSIIELLIHQNNIAEGVIRITLSRGNGPRGVDISPNTNPTVLITVNAYTRNENPITLCTAAIKINESSPLTQIKTLNYLEKILAKTEAKKRNYDDALLLNTKNRVVCASSANVFFIKNNELFTPPTEEGALPGTTREILLKIAAQHKIPVHAQPMELTFAHTAEEAFITNCLIGLRAVNRIDETDFEINKSSLTAFLQREYFRKL